MPHSAMTKVIAIRVEDELADLLNALTNKSEFIRAAILAQCVAKCPLCAGRGTVSSEIADMFAPILRDNRVVVCAKCGVRESIPVDLDATPDGDRVRWKRFLRGGDFVCVGCDATNAPAS